jgi:glycosyltransferase involved in cell wall biosynthesis
MRLLLIHHVADVYGSSKSLLRLTSGLAADGHSVMVALQEDGPLHAALNNAGVEVTIMPCIPVLHRNRLSSPAKIFALLRDALQCRRTFTALVKQFRPDLIHTNTGTILPIPGMVARRLHIPHIQHIRESFLDFGALWPPYRTWLVRYANRIACISHFMASMFTEKQRAGNVVVIHNGIPREEFDSIDSSAVAAFRRQFGGNDPIIGLVGRIKLVRKGQEVLVRAAERLKIQFPNAHYVCVGSPFPGNESHLDELKDMVQRAGLEEHFHFAGHMNDPLVAIAAFDISIMASSMPEPLGNVTIESMALGKPVIGTNIGGTPEIIVDGETGHLIPPSDPVAMADALAHLLENPEEARRMGMKGRERFVAAFEFATFYQNVVQLYEKTIKDFTTIS